MRPDSAVSVPDMPAIDLQDVSKTYGSVVALDQVSLRVEAGEWLAVMGPSGSGKTTLVNLAGCLDTPSSGSVWVDGVDVSSFSRRELARFRAEKIGFIFQQFHLVPYLTALENILLAQYFHSLADAAEAMAALERVGMAHRARHLPGQLSGGEQQRVSIARALINDPAIILADEPTGNLDERNEEAVMELLRAAHQAGKTLVMVTHDPTIARYADRRIQLHHGRITDISIFSEDDEREFDQILSKLWTLRENHEPLHDDSLRIAGPLSVGRAIAAMTARGWLCRENGRITLLPPGEKRASDLIRRHRLTELLFSHTFELRNEAELEDQAFKFEHSLSPEATARICAFLGHPRACPHGSPIPQGDCCPAAS